MSSINWTLVLLLTLLSTPGVFISIPRLIHLLLPKTDKQLRYRITLIATGQTILMLIILILTGCALSDRTQLYAPILTHVINQQSIIPTLLSGIGPAIAATAFAMVSVSVIYYGICPHYLSFNTRLNMQKLHVAMGFDSAILYSGISEELIARWGLMNLMIFFLSLFSQDLPSLAYWLAILISSAVVSIGQIPTYVAAGCHYNRALLYTILGLNGLLALCFGWLFWHYGLEFAILAHMTFRAIWWLVERYRVVL